MDLQYFKITEFDCPCGRKECDATPIDMETALKLDGLRRELGLPIQITSGSRCLFHNRSLESKDTSQHVLGRAIDIHCPDGIYMRRLVTLALKHGFTGIGIKDGMVHLDCRTSTPVMFGYAA